MSKAVFELVVKTVMMDDEKSVNAKAPAIVNGCRGERERRERGG